MAELSMPIHTAASAAEQPRRFLLSLSAEDKSRHGLLRALCLRAAFLALLAYCVYSAAVVVGTSWHLLGNQWANTYPEAPHVYAAIRAARTHRIYFPFTEQPYVLQSYGPLFYEMYYWMARALHADIHRFVQLARLTTFLSFLSCGALIAAISRRLGFSALVSIAAGMLALGVPLFCGYSVTTRPDMYCLAAMMASLALAVWTEAPSRWICILSGAFGAVAFLEKQPGLAVLLAIGLVWLLRKRFRELLWISLGAAVPIVWMFALLLWRRENFLGQYLSVGQAAWSFHSGLQVTRDALRSMTVRLPIVIGAMGFGRAMFSGIRAQMIASFALVNWLVGLSGMPQAGAAGNYFFGGLLGCGLLLPFAFEFVREKIKVAPALLLLALALGYATSSYAIVGILPQTNFTPNAYRALAEVRILSDRPEFSLYGRDPDLLDPISIHIVEVGSGHWSSAPVEAKVRDLHYDLVILACSGSPRVICSYRGINFFAQGVVDALNQDYSVLCSTNSALVLTPRGRSVKLSPTMLDAPLGATCDAKDQGQAPALVALRETR
jgi:hypothetical protein